MPKPDLTTYNRDPDEHADLCDHDRPLLDSEGKEIVFPVPDSGEYHGPSKGTCAECGAEDCCIGCRSSEGECYCEPD